MATQCLVPILEKIKIQLKMAKKIEVKANPYEKKEVVKSNQTVNISTYTPSDLNPIFDRIKREIEKRKNNLKEKGSVATSIVIDYYSFVANISVRRLETDKEYNSRIAKLEKDEELKRKKEEEKIKKEFKKLQELKSKYGDFDSAEEIIHNKRMEKDNKIFQPISN